MPEDDEVRNVLLLRGGALGDFLLTLPTIEALRRRWPRARLRLVTRSPAAALAVRCGLADEADRMDDVRWNWVYAPDAPVVKAPPADVVVNLLYDPDGVVGANLAACYPQAVHAAAAPYLPSDPPPVGAPHAADRLAGVLRKLGIAVVNAARALPLPPSDREAGRLALAAIGERVALIHPGSGGAAKNWPLGRFTRLARLIEAARIPVVFVLGEAEAVSRSLLQETWPAERLRIDPPLLDLARWLSACAAYIGNDSGVTHLAAALGAPTVAVFGPTDPAVWAPRGPQVTVVRAPGGRLHALDAPTVWAAAMHAAGSG